MSEFACSNGHLMRSGQLRCRECGEPLHTMDGMTSRQLEMEERYYQRLEAEEEWEGDE